MKRTIRIGGSISAVIPTASWANLRPTFTWEETIEDCDSINILSDDQICERIRILHDKTIVMLKESEAKAIVERIQRERQDLRFLRSPITKKMLPSVTSIIGYDADFFCSQEELRQYASQGNIIDAKVRHYIKTGKWVEAKELKDIWIDMVILKKGDLKLELDVGDFPAFLEKYPIKDMKVGERFFDDDEEYTGEPDFIGVPDWKGVEKVPTIFDIKRTPDKLKNGTQLSAYCKSLGIKQGIIVPLNAKTAQNYSKPVVYNSGQLDGYFKMFQGKQKEFKKRYGI